MKTRRLLATILCLVMVFTSQPFSTEALAAQVDDSIQTVTDAGQTTTSTEETAGDVNQGKSDETDGKDASAPTDDTENKGDGQTDSSESDTPAKQSDVKSDDDAGSTDDGTGSEQASEDGKDTKDAADGADSADDRSVDPDKADTADKADADGKTDGTDKTADDKNDVNAKEPENNGTDPDQEGTLVSNKWFEVNTADGILKIAADATLPMTGGVKIPAEARVIPAGLFNNADKAGKVSNVEFEADSQLTTIEAGAFTGSYITSIEIPAGVTEIKNATFKNSKLAEITISDTLTSIGDEAFASTPLTTFTAKGVTGVGTAAFINCASLTKVSLTSIQAIGTQAFKGCSKLNNFGFAPTLTTIGSEAFLGNAFTTVNLSPVRGELTLGNAVFESNTMLTKVITPDDLDEIPERTFNKCSKLTTVELGNSTTSRTERIGTLAFGNCVSLTEIITNNVRQFDAQAFSGDTKLTTVVIRYPNPTVQSGFRIEDDAFPALKSKLTMKGYDGKVKSYANSKGFKYVTLFNTNDIAVTKYDKEQVTIISSHNTAVKEGTPVKITITPAKGNVLTKFSVKANENVKWKLSGNGGDNGNTFEFTFDMPGSKPTVTAVVDKKENVKHGKLTYGFELVDSYQPELTTGGIVFDRAGGATQLVIKDGGIATNIWYFSFENGNTAVAKVSSTGLLRAVAPGSTTIKATSRLDGTVVKIPVTVSGEKVVIDNIALNVPAADDNIYEINGEFYPGVTFDMNDLKLQNEKVTASIEAYEANDNVSLMVESEWKSSDTNIATVANAKVGTNKNTITVKKGASGQAKITVTVKNEGEKTAKASNTKSFIINVVDTTPTVSGKNITVNSTSTVGTKLVLVPVEGYDIEPGSLTLCTLKSTSYTEYSKLKIVEGEADERGKTIYIRAKNPAAPFETTLSGSAGLYIRGRFESTGSQFTIPLTEVKVIKTQPDPTIKVSGKINLFYKGGEESGVVKMTQTVKNTPISRVRFVTAENHKNGYTSDPNDKFNNNFIAEPLMNTKGDTALVYIRRSENAMAQIDKKDVVSGYAYIYYEGFQTPVIREITIPTENVTPEYVLDRTTAVANTRNSGVSYDLKIVSKKNKKIAMDLSNLDVLKFTTGNTDGAFEELSVGGDDDCIVLTPKALKKGKTKAVFLVRDANWTKSLKFTFTLDVQSSLPKASLAKSTVELNRSYSGDETTVKVKLNQASSAVESYSDAEFTGSAANAAYADQIDIDGAGNILTVSLAPGANIKNGSYTFKLTPTVTCEGDPTPYDVNALTLTVKVVKKNPTVTLKNSTFTLNYNHAGNEVATTTYTLGNLPAGVDEKFLDSSYDTGGITPEGNAPEFDEIADLSIDSETNRISVSLKDDIESKYANKTFNYKMKGLTTEYKEGKVTAPKISIKIIKANVSVSVKASGSINPIDPTSRIVYKTTVKNYSGQIESVDVYAVNVAAGSSDDLSELFEAEVDEKNARKVNLSLKDGVEVKDKKYRLKLVYSIDGEEFPAYVNVKPKQEPPKVKVTAHNTNLYASSANRKTAWAEIKIEAKDKKTKPMPAQITGVEFAKGTSSKIKKAFDLRYDEESGTVEVELIDPTLAKNKTYTLKLVTVYEGQIADTAGSPFSIKVKVKK